MPLGNDRLVACASKWLLSSEGIMGRGCSQVTVPILALAGLGWAARPAWAEESILDPRFDLGIWTIVVFVVLFLVLRRYAWGPMLKGLQAREKTIHNALDEAKKAQADAQRLRDQFQAEMNKAQEKVRDLLDEARREAEQLKTDMVSRARTEIQAERDRLRREIESARDQALQELWNQTALLATMISSKAIRRQLTADDHRRLVDEALAELKGAGNEWQRQVASVRA
jgi:F-type H+-transporting ATPase subunit b